MGRFYKTASATPLDYMYRINAPLMERVLKANDQAITSSLDAVGTPVSYEHIGTPEEDADYNKIIQGYNQKMDDISEAVRADPANWRGQMGNIRGLKKDLQADYATGAISKQIYNYNKRKQIFDDLDSRSKIYHESGGTKGLSPEAVAAAKNQWDAKFTKTGYDPTNPGVYNVYKGGSLMDEMDVPKLLKEGLEKMKADKRFSFTQVPGKDPMYFNEETHEYETITPDRIVSYMMGNFSPQIRQYLKERTDLGLINGVYSKDGKLIVPYTHDPIPMTDEEKRDINALQTTADKTKDESKKAALLQQIKDANTTIANRRELNVDRSTYLGNIIGSGVDEFRQDDRKDMYKKEANPVEIAKYHEGNENYRFKTRLDKDQAMHDETQKNLREQNDRDFAEKVREHDETLAEKVREWDNPHATGVGGMKGISSMTGKGTTTTTPAYKPPENTAVNSLSTESFVGKTTLDKHGQEVNEYSAAGVAGDIVNNKRRIADIDKQLGDTKKWLDANSNNPDKEVQNAVSLYKNSLSDLQLEKQKTEGVLESKREVYNATLNTVLNKSAASKVTLTDDDIKLFKEFDNDRDGSKLKANITKLSEEANKIQRQSVKHAPLKEIKGESFGEREVRQNIKVAQESSANSKEIQAAWDKVTDAQNKLKKYNEVKNRVDNGMENVMEIARKRFIDSDAIVPTSKESDDVSAIVLHNTRGLGFIDSDGQVPTGFKQGGTDVDKYKMDFSGGDDLKAYMDATGTTMTVKSMGSSTDAGKGNAVVEVTFNDPKGHIPKNKSYFIITTPELQRDLSNRFANHADPRVAKIGKDLGDPERNDVKNQFADVAAGHTSTITVSDYTGKKYALKVHHLDDGRYNVTNTDNQPIPRVDGNGHDGVFASPDDFFENYEVIKEEDKAKREAQAQVQNTR